MNRELLWECFWQLKDARASGIDRVTKEQYAEHLMENLDALIGRLHRMAYVPQPVRRVYIPKPGSDKQRPLGIPVLEDKLVQAGLSKILEAIYEEDFVEDSYGFRPGRSCHDALRVLGRTIERQGTQYVVEADIKAFFDNVAQDQLMAFTGPVTGGPSGRCHFATTGESLPPLHAGPLVSTAIPTRLYGAGAADPVCG